MTHESLLAEPTPPPTYLPENTEAARALADGEDPSSVAARFPAYTAAWAALAERALASDPVAAYAYARTGYHRGLDLLRRSGWRGYGPIPWEHEPNRGRGARGEVAPVGWQIAPAVGDRGPVASRPTGGRRRIAGPFPADPPSAATGASRGRKIEPGSPAPDGPLASLYPCPPS